MEALPEGSTVTEDEVAGFCRERSIRYDRDEDEHYDTASAFIKSMRGNDPDAALYWLAKMLAGGEDPRFIARRLVIFASEDVGMADSRALLMADAAFRACETIGLPECELNLAHVVIFLATCPKSNSATLAIGRAKRALSEKPVQPFLRAFGTGTAETRIPEARTRSPTYTATSSRRTYPVNNTWRIRSISTSLKARERRRRFPSA